MPISRKMSTRWGVGTIVIPAPLEVDEYMRSVPLEQAYYRQRYSNCFSNKA